MDIKELQSKTIDYLRFPLAVFVVFIHTSQANISLRLLDYSALSGKDVYDILTVIFSQTIATIAVPLFFVISGYLFFISVKEWNKNEYVKKLKSRAKTLLVPYLVWNAIVLLLAVGRALYVYYTSGEVNYLLEQLTTVGGWLKPFWNQSYFGPATNIIGKEFYISFPYNGPFWFIRDLIGMCLLSPLIYLVARYAKIWGIVVLYIALLTSVWIHVPGFGIEAFTYFTLGAYLSIHRKNLVELARKGRIPFYILFVATLLLLLYGLPETRPVNVVRVVSLLFVFSGGVSAINLASYLLERGKVKVSPLLSKSSFMVFAAHGILVSAVKPVFQFLLDSDSIILNILSYFLYPLFVAGLCVLVYYIVVNYLPRLSTILVGSRGRN